MLPELVSIVSLVTNQPPGPDDWKMAFAALFFCALGLAVVVAYLDDLSRKT